MYDRCITRGVTGSFFPSIHGNGSQIVRMPWKVALPITHVPGCHMFEYAGHEGNQAMANRLSTARAEDRAAAQKKSNKQ